MLIPLHDRASVMREIEARTREGALYYTDEWQALMPRCGCVASMS